MQLTAKGGNMVVDFYPETSDPKRFIKVVTFMPNTDKPVKSYSSITKLDFKNEVNNRLAKGYEVTELHTEVYDNYATYSPMMC